MIFVCLICKIEFSRKKRNNANKYCSRACFRQSCLGKPAWNKGLHRQLNNALQVYRQSNPSWNKGRKVSEETRQKIIAGLKARNIKPETREKLRLSKLGDKNPLWRGGVSPVHKVLRNTSAYRQWRNAVYKRDYYRCLDCGEKGGRLNADHIYPFAYYPRLRFDINNGQTLCEDCHRKTPTFSFKALKFKPEAEPASLYGG